MSRVKAPIGTWVRAVLVASVTVGACFTAASPAEACSCRATGPACQAYWNTDAVFDATVVRIEPTTRDEVLGDELLTISKRLVTLEVKQTWKGLESARVHVVTDEDEAGCGFTFKEGVRYLVFARHGRSGELEVSLCSATREFDGAGDAAEFLTSLATPGPGGRVFGTLRYSAAASGENPVAPFAFADVTVTLSGPESTVTTQARGGKYEFSALPAGSYNVSATAPAGYTTTRWPGTVEIPAPHACAEHDFLISPATGIIGQVVDAGGRAISGVHVEFVAADAVLPVEYHSVMSVHSDASGYFDLRGLSPGRYVAGLNLRDFPSEYSPYPLTLYPGPALPVHVIDLALGQLLDLGRWEIPPPVPVVRIAGTIVWEDGTPAAGVRINLRDVTNNPRGRARGAGIATSAADGRFGIEGREGRTYSVTVRLPNLPPLLVGSVRVAARQGMDPIRIVIPRQSRD